MCKYTKITTIAFDADDTLWENENHYRDVENKFCELFTRFGTTEFISKELLKTETLNIDLYGYGVKSFTLSMIETAIRISSGKVNPETITTIIELGKELINMPLNILPEVKETLETLKKRYRLVLATKGDLLDQQRKLKKSELENLFSDVEIMSNKRANDYLELIKKLKIVPQEFLMVGNTIKSDIVPVIEIGASAIHIPYYITWNHEETLHNNDFETITNINEILKLPGIISNC